MFRPARRWLLDTQARALPAGSLRARLAHGAMWSSLGTAGSQATGLVVSVVTARFLGQAGFGEYGIVLGTLAVLGNLAGLGPAVSATKHVAEFRARDERRVAGAAAAALSVASLVGLVAAGAVFTFAEPLAASVLNAPRLGGTLELGSVLVILYAVGAAQSGALAGFEAFQATARIALLRGLVSLPLVIAGVWIYKLPGAVGASVLVAGTGVWLSHRALVGECRRRGLLLSVRGGFTELEAVWRFSLPAFLAGALPGAVTWVATVILVHQRDGHAQMGLFSAADQWRGAVVAVPTVVGTVSLPILSHLHGSGHAARFARFLWRSMGLNGLVSGFAAFLVVAFAPRILALYGASFVPGRGTLVLLALTGVSVAVNAVIGNGIIAAGWIWWGLLFNVLWGGVLLACWCILTPNGAYGLALACFLAYCAHTCWQVAFLLSRWRLRS
jgi:O-antigen/teichoic acid export membrane protein